MILLAGATALAGIGLALHNLLSLPGSPLAPETVVPLAVYAALLVWHYLTRSAAARIALVTWGMLNLVGGGIVSVLPLPFLPFVPEQTAGHYVAHAIYVATQVPLIVIASMKHSSSGTRP